MALISVPYVIASGSHSAELFRDALQALIAGTGVVGSGDLQVSAHSPANMSVNVAVGQAVVPGTLGATGVFPNNLNYQGYTGNVTAFTQQGVYYAYNNAVVNLTISAADPTNPRIDLVVISDPDAQYSGSSNTPVLQVITGTPAPSPSPPTCPASSIVLAQVAVAANATSISSGNITDKRPYARLLGFGDAAWTGAAGVTFSNGWTDYGSPSAFGFKRTGTKVEFRGAIKSGTVGSTAFTLPAGYFPTQNLNIPVDSNGAFGDITITSAGVVTVGHGSNTWVSLDNVSFDTI